MGKIYEDQIGVKFELKTESDLTSATLTEIKYKLADGTKAVWPATIDGTKIFYVTVAGDLAKSGTIQMQAHVSGVGFDLLGETVSTLISKNWG